MPRCTGCRRDLIEQDFDSTRTGILHKTCRQCLVSYPICEFIANVSQHTFNIIHGNVGKTENFQSS